MHVPLREGSPAPQFSLPRDGGSAVDLDSFRGRNLVLYFYPRDDTAGCTREAIEFNAAREAFGALDTDILGISDDPVAKHDRFKKKHDLAIPLASDEERAILSAYGVWTEKNLYGKKYMGTERTTFLIDRAGVIARIWRKVRVPGHVEEVLEACRALAE